VTVALVSKNFALICRSIFVEKAKDYDLYETYCWSLEHGIFAVYDSYKSLSPFQKEELRRQEKSFAVEEFLWNIAIPSDPKMRALLEKHDKMLTEKRRVMRIAAEEEARIEAEQGYWGSLLSFPAKMSKAIKTSFTIANYST
jgi:hypothetical protein